MRLKLFAVIGFVSAGLMACEQPGPPTPQIRSVRAVTVERRVVSEPVVLIGQIRARNEISLAFRISLSECSGRFLGDCAFPRSRSP